uniref:Pecanex-like protein n=1 Tax=Macrostomum lignano TaxID=282301 RepID=A0A1I8FS59_9PLAT
RCPHSQQPLLATSRSRRRQVAGKSLGRHSRPQSRRCHHHGDNTDDFGPTATAGQNTERPGRIGSELFKLRRRPHLRPVSVGHGCESPQNVLQQQQQQ